jgi:hypothetical protein
MSFSMCSATLQFIRGAALPACMAIALSACGGGSDSSAGDALLAVAVIGPTTPAPTAQGRVTSQPAGIDCGSSCEATFAIDTAVTLTAAAPAGQQFSAWGGACSGSAATCDVTLSTARSVTAAFITAPAAGGWSDQAVVSVDGAGDARVRIDAAGIATAVWLQLDPGTNRRSVWASRRPVGGPWSAPALLESSDIDFFEVELAVDASSGRAMAVWRGATVQEVYARPADAVGVWGTTTRINGSGNNVLDLQVGIDANGNAVAVWTQTPTGPLQASRVWSNRYSSASGWGSAQTVSVLDTDVLELDPSLSVSAGGRAFVVWTRNGSGVMVSHAEPDGAWADAAVLAAGQVSTGVGAPHVVADANGHAMAVWAQGARNSSNQFVTNLASKRFADGAWSGTPAPLYAPEATNVLSDARLAVNGPGQFAAVWSQPDASVRAVQSNAAGVWGSAATVRAASTLELRGLPAIGIDSLGNMFATWAARSDTPAGTPEVWLSRFTTGSAWAQAAVHQTGADATGDPRIAMNDRGHAAMVWLRSGSDGSRVIDRYFTSGR